MRQCWMSEHGSRLQRVRAGVWSAQPQRANQVRQCQTLQQQRPGSDHHRREDQHVARKGTSSGIRNAVASVTTPRSPAQPITKA